MAYSYIFFKSHKKLSLFYLFINIKHYLYSKIYLSYSHFIFFLSGKISRKTSLSRWKVSILFLFYQFFRICQKNPYKLIFEYFYRFPFFKKSDNPKIQSIDNILYEENILFNYLNYINYIL